MNARIHQGDFSFQRDSVKDGDVLHFFPRHRHAEEEEVNRKEGRKANGRWRCKAPLQEVGGRIR